MRTFGFRLLTILFLPALLAAAGPGTWAPSGDCTPTRYEQAAGLLADGRVLVTGGQGGMSGEFLTSAKLFQAPSGWSDVAPMAQPRSVHTQTLLADGRVLVAGGHIEILNPDGSGTFVYLNSAEIYSPSTNTWAPAAAMNEARGFHTATLLSNGKVLVAGGVSPATLSSAEIYDPVLNTWTEVAPMTQPRWSHAALKLLDGRVLVAASWLAAMPTEIYDPVAGTWTPSGFLSSGGFNNLLFQLPDGRVLFCDGTVFTFSLATQTWTQGASMPVGTNPVSADLLKDGRLIVTGGQNDAVQADVRVYDPTRDTWTIDASMANPRSNHSTVTMPDGRVVVACGFTGSGLIAATELYTPAASDTTPPVITAPASVVVEQTSPAGAPASIPVSAVDAVDGPVPVTSDAPAIFPPGKTTVHFTAVDHAGNVAHASTEVLVVDTTPPTITSIRATPSALWPPNGKLVPVALTVGATDLADPAPKSMIHSITSNEPPGAGETDWVITGHLAATLRAKKNHGGATRIYTIVVRCTDASGNFSDKPVTVAVTP